MNNIDIIFSRNLLREAHKLAKLHLPTGTDVRKAAWVWHAGRNHWEFHGPDKFYWHGRASNAWEARYKGWMAWLAKFIDEPSS